MTQIYSKLDASKSNRFPFGELSPEHDLLLSCLRPEISEKELERIRDLARQPLDWDFLIYEAQYHHAVMPLFYQQLKKICPDLVPIQILERFRQAYEANARHNLALTGELLKIIGYFKEQEIPVIAFKGPVLAQLIYGDTALRQFADLDLLVPETDYFKAKKLFGSLGYSPEYELTPYQEGKNLKTGYELNFFQAEKEIAVDLHWAIIPKGFSFSPDYDFLWQNLESLKIFGKSITTLTGELLLLYHCSHASKHSWFQLSYLTDLAWLIQTQPNLKWDWILQQTGRLGTKRMLLIGLSLVNISMEVSLPSVIEIAISNDTKLVSLNCEIFQLLFPKKKSKSLSGTGNRKTENNFLLLKTPQSVLNLVRVAFEKMKRGYERYRLYRRTIEKPSDQIKDLWLEFFVPEPKDWNYLKIPENISFLYLPIKQVRRVGRYLGKSD